MYSNRNRSIISTDRQIEYVLQSPPCSNLIDQYQSLLHHHKILYPRSWEFEMPSSMKSNMNSWNHRSLLNFWFIINFNLLAIPSEPFAFVYIFDFSGLLGTTLWNNLYIGKYDSYSGPGCIKDV